MHEYLDKYTEPEFDKIGLVTIDVQCDTLNGQPFEVPGTSAILPRVSQLVRAFRERHRPIVHIVRIYQHDGSNVDLCRRARVLRGQVPFAPASPGVRLAPGLLGTDAFELDCSLLLNQGIQPVAPTEVVMYKSRWGAFYGTQLEQWLHEQQVTTIAFAGCNFPNCPRTSIYQASERDFRILLAKDATSMTYDVGLRELQSIGVAVMDTEELVTQLDRSIAA